MKELQEIENASYQMQNWTVILDINLAINMKNKQKN